MQDRLSNNEPQPYVRPNKGQADYWNSSATAPWVTLQKRLDTLMAPLAEALIAVARPARGENVLDIGCGCGATVLDLARCVDVTGHVIGIDISTPMLGRAQERLLSEGISQVTLTLADAATEPFPPGTIDLAFSRLGIMFFDDPVLAFANIRRALKPSGRIVFLCCRAAPENRYITMAIQAARPLLPIGAVPIPLPALPGMFSLADATRVESILKLAGFRDIALLPFDQPMFLAGPGCADEAAAFSVQFGPLTRVLDDAEPAMRKAILETVAASYRTIEGPEGIILDGAFWIVTARP